MSAGNGTTLNSKKKSKLLRNFLKNSRNFGLILPSGWHGRPDDNFYNANSVEFGNNLVRLVLPGGEMKIAGDPKIVERESLGDAHISDGRALLVFEGADRFELIHNDHALSDIVWESPEFIMLVRM